MAPVEPNRIAVLDPKPRRDGSRKGRLRIFAPAKINLDLLVGPVRDDGFHPLDSIVATVTLYDEIVLSPRGDGRISLKCENADCGPAERNLAYRAAKALAEDVDTSAGLEISLVKRIPPGMGLGGGSSDAAAVLEGLDCLWGLHTPADRLAEMAASLGSDVPLFLGPPAARMTGRGEKLAPAKVHDFAALLHMPEFPCVTAAVYRAFDALPGAGQPMQHRGEFDIAAQPPSAWRGMLRNDLAPAAEAVCPELRQRMELLGSATGAPVCLTGSGSAMFVLADDVAEAQSLADRLPTDLPGRCVIVQPTSR